MLSLRNTLTHFTCSSASTPRALKIIKSKQTTFIAYLLTFAYFLLMIIPTWVIFGPDITGSYDTVVNALKCSNTMLQLVLQHLTHTHNSL